MKKAKGIKCYIGPKRLAVLLLLVAFIIIGYHFYRLGAFNPAVVAQYKDIHPIRTLVLFGLTYVVSVVLALPTLPLNLAAGLFFGGVPGGIYTAICVTLGSWVSFCAARLIVGQPLANCLKSKWGRIVQEEFESNDWKFLAFARLNPIIPTGPLNYFLGLTSLSHSKFLIVTFLFLLPPSTAISYIGDSLQTFTRKTPEVENIMSTLLVLSASVTLLIIIRFISKIFRKNRGNL